MPALALTLEEGPDPIPPFAAELAALAAGAAERDRDRSGAFPEAAVVALDRAGLLAAPARQEPLPFADELELLYAVGRADAGVARIVDGHFNAVERLRVQVPDALRERELPAIARGELRAGVWAPTRCPTRARPPACVETCSWASRPSARARAGCSAPAVVQRRIALPSEEAGRVERRLAVAHGRDLEHRCRLTAGRP